MNKVKYTILKSVLSVLLIVLFLDFSIIYYLYTQKNSIIHNIDKDILIDKWWEICTALLVLIIPLTAVSAIHLLFIDRHKAEYVARDDRKIKAENNFAPTLSKTSHNNTLTLTLCKDFDKEFMPRFANARNTPNGDTKLEILKSALLSNTWTQTELARIALLLKDSGELQPTNNKLIPWIRKFFDMVGRTDVPKAPARKDFAFTESEDCQKILKVFRDLVETATERDPQFLQKIKRRKE